MPRRSTIIIILVSFILFLIRLNVCQHLFPDIFSYDFYGYIKLTRNIFNDLNFSVRWIQDNPIKYPPLFSILTGLVNFLTKDDVVSMQYINAFSTSFILVPLFFLVRNLLNEKSAILTVIFITYYYGIQSPCYNLRADYFFSLLTITICWLTWKFSLAPRPLYFFLLGCLISLAYLTKYLAILYCPVVAIVIFCVFMRHCRGLRTSLKMVSFLMLGFLPIFIIYQAIFYGHRYQKVSDIGTYTFFDGNYRYEGRNFVKLNPEGTEFEYETNYKNNNVLVFCIHHPKLLWGKYVEGFKRMVRMLTVTMFPLTSRTQSINIHFSIQEALIVLLILSMLYYKRHDKIALVLLFVLIMLGIPIYYTDPRYPMPFMSLYFILWLFVINIFFDYLNTKIINGHKNVLKFLASAIYIFFIFVYSMNCYRGEVSFLESKRTPPKEYLQAASWIKEDSKKALGNIKIMAWCNALAYLADVNFIRLPLTEGEQRIVHFAVLKKVNYIILVKTEIGQNRYQSLVKNISEDSHVRMVYRNQIFQNAVVIFKILA